MQEINFKLAFNSEAGDWTLEINGKSYESLCAESVRELLINTVLCAKKTLLEDRGEPVNLAPFPA